MPRKPASPLPDTGSTSPNEGNYRQDIFRHDVDRQKYLELTRALCRRAAGADHGLLPDVESRPPYRARQVSASRVGLDAVPQWPLSRSGCMSLQERRGRFWQDRFYSCVLDEATSPRGPALRRTQPGPGGTGRTTPPTSNGLPRRRIPNTIARPNSSTSLNSPVATPPANGGRRSPCRNPNDELNALRLATKLGIRSDRPSFYRTWRPNSTWCFPAPPLAPRRAPQVPSPVFTSCRENVP